MISAFGIEHEVRKSFVEANFLRGNGSAWKRAADLSGTEKQEMRHLLGARAQHRAAGTMLRGPFGGPDPKHNKLYGSHLDKMPTRASGSVKNLHFGEKTSPEHQQQVEHMLAGRKLKRPVVVHVDSTMNTSAAGGGVTIARPKRMKPHVVLAAEPFEKDPAFARRILHHEITHSQVKAGGTGMRKPGTDLHEEARADHLSARHSPAKTYYEQGRSVSPRQESEYREHRSRLQAVAKSAFGVEHVAKRAPTELFEHAHALRSAGDQPLTNARRTTENFDSKAKMAQGRDGEAIPNPFGTRKVRLVRRQTLDREATAGRKAEMIRGLAKSAFGIEIGKGAEHLAAVASSARKLRRLGFAARELPLPMQPRSAQPWAHTAEEVESSRRRLGIQSHVSAVKAARAEHRANIRTALQAGHSAEEIARVAPRGTGASPGAVKQLARAR